MEDKFLPQKVEDMIDNLHCSLFHMTDEEARPVIDKYLETYPILLEYRDREWYYKNC